MMPHMTRNGSAVETSDFQDDDGGVDTNAIQLGQDTSNYDIEQIRKVIEGLKNSTQL